MDERKRLTVYLIGNDKLYYGSLRKRFEKEYPEYAFDFKEFASSELFDPQRFYVKCNKRMPEFVFVDFSLEEEKCFRFCKLLRRDNRTKKISTTAIFDYLIPEETISRSLMAGNRINQIKGTDVGGVIYDAFVLYAPEEAKYPAVALASQKGEISYLIQDLRLSYITREHFKIETNTLLPEGQIVELSKHALKGILESNKFKVSKVAEDNLYYNARYAIFLDYFYSKYNEPGMDEYLKSRRIPQETIDAKLEEVRNNVTRWVNSNYKNLKTKTTKILIIDRTLNIFHSIKGELDDYPFSINVQSILTEQQIQINRHRPNIISFVYEQLPEGEGIDPFSFNSDHSLREIVETVKKIPNYMPIIVVFNSNVRSSDFQSKFQYKKILTYQDDPDIDIIAKFAHGYDDSIEEDPEKRVYFSSTDLNTVLQCKRQVELVAISEFLVYFKTQDHIPKYTVFRMDSPVKMLVTVVPMSPEDEFAKEKNCYKAIINGLDDYEKQQLRQSINKIFFREKELEKKKEREEFEQLNQTVGKERKEKKSKR